MNIDLDDDIMQTLKDLGADTSTVKGVQKFYEILGKAFIEFIENSDEIDDSEKLKLKNLLKT